MDNQPVTDEHYRIILVGKRGSGKSTTGNTLLGAEKFQTRSGVTKEVKRSLVVHKARKGGRKVTFEITDTPGFSDTKGTDEEMKTMVVNSVNAYRPEFYIFLYVMKFNGYEKEDFVMYKRFLDLFGPEMTLYTIPLFTGGDYLKKMDSREELEKLLGEDFPAISRNFVVFDNKTSIPEKKKKQTDKLLDKIKAAMEMSSMKPFQCDLLKEVDKKVRQVLKRRANNVDREKKKKPRVEKGQS